GGSARGRRAAGGGETRRGTTEAPGRSGPDVDPRVGRVAVDLGKLVIREVEAVERSEGVVELLEARDADRRRRHARVAQRPRERRLGERLSAPRRDLVQRADLLERLVAQ